ncbi:MAG: methionine gamma-lyase family protein [Oscillospiraceae bacterium]|nr:methionine gamma-lyase family protein [Oscillospiraceae bacterium]MDY4192379.1 methionine gamma-lyase family protein [Oscillospiraceae bacterium]
MEQPFFKIDPRLTELGGRIQKQCAERFAGIDEIAEYNQMKVMAAFRHHRVSESHFAGSTGYGYDDRGRETLEAVMAEITGSEDALMRHNFVSGTHTLATALFGVLRPGDVMLSITGTPYDTIRPVIGITGENCGSLKEFGVEYREVALLPDGTPDRKAIAEAAADPRVRMAYVQRSRGYSLRPSITMDVMKELVDTVKAVNPSAVFMVDNCYGIFTDTVEPTQLGADLIAGSLIKNAGGGIARTGGYIAGRADLIEQCAYRLTTPGQGKEVGCTLGELRGMFQGLFLAPHVVGQAVRTASFASRLFEELGYGVTPRFDERRTDIIQSVMLENSESLIAFCQGIQKGSPVDSFVSPEPWDMPGYDSKVIMAAGAFTLGSSIELSADAPLREPYAVWMQGGLTYASGKTGVLLAAQSMLEQGLLKGLSD